MRMKVQKMSFLGFNLSGRVNTLKSKRRENLVNVYFSHGKESGPWGSKIKYLADMSERLGFNVSSIDYTDIKDPDLRAERLINILKQDKGPFLLVGSSMGGYVSLVAAEKTEPSGIFLMAPALFMPGYNKQEFSNGGYVEIVHGWSDEVIPPENSIRFARENDTALHLISGDHRLNDSLVEVGRLFRSFLEFYRT